MAVRTPVRMSGRMAAPRSARAAPAPSPFTPDLGTVIQMFTEMASMHEEVLGQVAALEQKHKNFDNIKKGSPGAPGMPGPTPNHERIVADVLKKVRTPQDGKSPKISELAGALLPLMVKHFNKHQPKVVEIKPAEAKPVDTEALLDQLFEEIKSGKRKLQVGHIDGLDTKFAEVRNAAAMGTPEIYGKNTWKRGGGDTVVAGPGIAVTETADGTKKITNTGASGFNIIAVSGTINDTNVTFTAASQPKLLNINGAFYQQTGGAYTWTYLAGTITLNAAVGTGGSIFGI